MNQKILTTLQSNYSPRNRMNIAVQETTSPGQNSTAEAKGSAHSVFDPDYAEAHDRRILIVDDEDYFGKLI
jgi:hypothetical protein